MPTARKSSIDQTEKRLSKSRFNDRTFRLHDPSPRSHIETMPLSLSDKRNTQDTQCRSQRKEEMRRDAIRHLKNQEKIVQEKKKKIEDEPHDQVSLDYDDMSGLIRDDEEKWEKHNEYQSDLFITKPMFDHCIRSLSETTSSFSTVQLESKTKVALFFFLFFSLSFSFFLFLRTAHIHN
jgi:hypothetical protein